MPGSHVSCSPVTAHARAPQACTFDPGPMPGAFGLICRFHSGVGILAGLQRPERTVLTDTQRYSIDLPGAHGHTEVQHRFTNYGLEPKSYECCESRYTMRIREILGNRLQLRYRLALHVIGSPPHKGCDGPVIAVTATLKNACHHPPTPQDGSHM